MKTILVTGHAGFIGSALVQRLFKEMDGGTIVGIDNCNAYYDIRLKAYRLNNIKLNKPDNIKYMCIYGSITDRELINGLFNAYKFDIVVNLAAQPGVRSSIINPTAHIENNIVGFYNILEACRHQPVQHLVYASSSSVYGDNEKVPFSEDDNVDNPASLYAVTKRSNELMAQCYSKLYNIPCTGLRFFTVYGPAGRPDMAYYDFTNKLRRNETIDIYNYGNCTRDFTYIDDVVEGIVRVMFRTPKTTPHHKIYNLGCGQPIKLTDFVLTLQQELYNAGVLPKDYDFESHIRYMPMQPGDAQTTHADITAMKNYFKFIPKTALREGLKKFTEWYAEYYK